MSRLRFALVALVCLLSPAAMAASVCPAAGVITPLAVPQLRKAISHGIEGVIVALGSSSTQGAMASNAGRSYPAVLQATLAAGLPDTHIAVLNRGIGGQDAAEGLARLEADVLAVRPQLVIWQVGANGALRNADPVAFHDLVVRGVRRIQAAGADVILMDNQHAPALIAKVKGAAFDQTLAQVAAETGAGLFSRRGLMLGWERGGAPISDFIASDGLHHNDRGYLCVAQSLAQAILAGLTPGEPVTASR